MPGVIPNIQHEDYYQLVADNINDLVALYTLEGCFSYLSPSVYRVLGYEGRDFLGCHARDLIHPDDLYLLNYSFHPKHQDKCESVNFEYRLKHSNGDWIYFDSYRKPIRDIEGNLTGVLAVCRDISSRKKAETALRESEIHYRMLADNIIDMVAMYTIDGTTLYVSPSCYSLLGYTQAELTGCNITGFIHPDDLLRFAEDVKLKAYKGVEKFITEARMRHKNGNWRHCETTTKAMRDNKGRVHSFICTTRDITEWKHAQIALKESEEKYRSLVEASDALIAVIDLKGTFLFVNDKRAAYFKKPKEEIIGKTIYEFYGPKDTIDFAEKLEKIHREKTNISYEAHVDMSGTDVWLCVNLHPVFDADGEVTAILVNTLNITKEKAREEALKAQNDELKKIAFLQSHIVRSPLTNIQGILALLDGTEFTEQQAFYISLLKQATSKLDAIIHDIVMRAVAVRHKNETLDEKH